MTAMMQSVKVTGQSKLSDVLFDGKDLIVLSGPIQDREILVVTFTGRGRLDAHGDGAGRAFVSKYGLSGVYFISKANHWWQTHEFEAAIESVNLFAKKYGFTNIVTYGASMGGYGALAASSLLNATRAVVFVPQFTINLDKVPWEERYRKDAARINFVRDDISNYIGEAKVSIFLDPFFELDVRHAKLIEKSHPAVNLFPIPFSEHDASAALADCGILSYTVLGALRGTLTSLDFRQTLRKNRRRSWLIWAGASRILYRKGRIAWALRLIEKSYEILSYTDKRHKLYDLLVIEHYASLLHKVSRNKAALELLAIRYQQKRPVASALHVLKGKILEHIGDAKAARLAYEAALTITPLDRISLAGRIRQFGDVSELQSLLKTEFLDTCLKYPSVSTELIRKLNSLGMHAERNTFLGQARLRFPNIERFRKMSP